METRFSKVLACLFAGILTATAADYSVFAAQTSTLEYYVCPNSKMLKEDETDYSEMTANGTLLFSAAANERESAQIILTKEGEYKNFALQLEDDLTDDKDNSIPKENFEIYFEHYIEVEKYWELKIPTAKYPDALIPEKLAEKVGANTFTLDEQKKNQGIWFTVTIPPGTPAGTYEGKLTGSLDVNVEVKVYDFELPQKTSSCTSFSVSPRMKEDTETAIKKHIGIQNDEVKRQYQEIFSELLNERKIGSGYVHSSEQTPDETSLKNDVEKLYEFITNPNTKSPYYNLGALDNVYRDNPAPISLDCSGSKEDIIMDFQKKSGIELDKAEDIKAILQSVIPDTSCTQKDIVDQIDGFKGSDEEKELASLLHYLLSTNPRINRYPVKDGKIGVEMFLKAIVDKSYEKKFDMLQYAFIKDPCTDEPPDYSFRKNISVLANSYIFDDIKKELENYISEPENAKDVNPQIQQELRASLKKLNIMISKAPDAKTNQWRVILSEGIQAKTNSKVWEYYKQFAQKKYGIQVTEEDKEIKFTEKYNTSEKPQKIPGTSDYYSITIKPDYHIKGFMALYNDFSTNTVSNPHSIDFSSSYSDYLNDPEYTSWWYCCNQSGKNASIPGYMINCNQGNYYDKKGAEPIELNLNPLAVARANKWQQFNLGISGEYNWGVDIYFKNSETLNDEGEIVKGERIFKDDIGIAARGDDWAACDGMMVYPIKELLKNVYGITDESKQNEIASEYNYLCSSIRLENVSEAIDDYDYLCLAEQSVIRHPEYRDCLDTIICSVIEPGNVDYTNANLTNSANLAKARSELAKLIVDCQTDGQSEATNMESIDFDIPDVKYWNVSGKVLCFDVYETDNIQNTDSKTVKFTLMSEKTFLNHRIEIDFNTKTVSDCEGAKMIPKKNGLYTIYIPLDNVRKYDESSGEETLTHIHFSKDDVNCSFYAMNFQVYQEVTNTYPQRFENTYSFSSLDNWYNSGKTLCFDVRETDTYHNPDGSRTASIYLRTNQTDAVETTNMNHRIHINFADFSVEGCDGAQMYHKGEGWYTVQIPLDKITLYDGFDGSQPLTGIHFSGSDVNTSFLLDGVRVYQEVAKIYPMKFENTLSLPSIKDWYNNGKTLSFDVRETDTYHASNGSRTVSFYLRTDKAHAVETTNMNHRIYINFAEMRVEGCNGAMMYHKKDRWYTVQIPLDQLTLYDGFDGSQPITGVHFSGDDVNTSFLFDTDSFRVSQEVTNIYPKYFGNTFSFFKIENWYGHGKTLSFDVRETDTYHNPDGSRTVSFYLRTDKENAVNTVNMNHRIHIDFADMSITGCDGAQMYLNEHNWYTVQIPLDKIPLYNGFDGTQPLTGIHFSGGDVNTSFIFDTDSFRITEKAKENPVISIHAQPSKTVLEGDMNEDGCADESDVIELQNYLTGKDKNIQISWQEADLDHNGVLNAVDLTLLKRMLLAQQ